MWDLQPTEIVSGVSQLSEAEQLESGNDHDDMSPQGEYLFSDKKGQASAEGK